MGYGSYSQDAHAALISGRTAIPVQQVFQQRASHPLMDPKGVKLREGRDSPDHPQSLGIVFALDVTGSMGKIPHLLAVQELPKFMKVLMDCRVADPQLLFMAVGDATSDRSPLQVGQYAVRHGPGPLPTETGELREAVVEHNGHGEWQGAVRYGWFDAVLARYAMEVAGPLDALALTHLDVAARTPRFRLCGAYRIAASAAAPGEGDLLAARDAAGLATRLAAPRDHDLERQERLTALLHRARPVLEECAPTATAALAAIERLLDRPIDLVSHGPRASDVAHHARCDSR
jgi:hypothetical protein